MKKLFDFDEILFGADYNPEQWPQEVWQEDIKLMQAAQVNCVSLGIFSWAKIEPNDGIFSFDWLDTIIEMLHQGGIKVNLASATASPPAWLCKKHPDILPIDIAGQTLWPGSRQHYNPASESYRSHARRLIGAIAKRYGKHPAVISWHINNEYACHIQASFDDESARHFRYWLELRYEEISHLNRVWNTAFWSQNYESFDEILPPRKAPHNPNPGQLLDWKRFWSDKYVELVEMELAIIRELSPGIPVSTNLVGEQFFFDRRALSKNLDYVSWDSYPDPALGLQAASRNAMHHDFIRSLKADRPFVLMEQVNTQVNWRAINSQKPEGVMRAQSFQAIARGADGIMYFQWRQSKAGDEMFHGALVPHLGAVMPNGEETRAFREVRELGQELKNIKSIIGSIQKPQVAILYNAESHWALSLPSKPASIDTIQCIETWHKAFWNDHIDLDIVHPDDDLSGYKLIVAPALFMLSQTQANKIESFVEHGGKLICGYFSGIVDQNNHAYLGGHPRLLQKVLGIWVEEWHPLQKNECVTMIDQDCIKTEIHNWHELVHLAGAQAIASYDDGALAGNPSVTRNYFGKGSAYYLAADIDAPWIETFIISCIKKSGLRKRVISQAGLETSIRENDTHIFIFIINHNQSIAKADLASLSGTDLLSGKTFTGPIELNPQEVLILEIARSKSVHCP